MSDAKVPTADDYARAAERLLRSVIVLAGTPGSIEVLVSEYAELAIVLRRQGQHDHADYVDALRNLARLVLDDVKAEVGA